MRNYLKSSDGAVAAIVAVTALGLIVCLAFAMDVGHLAMKANELQNAADAAALAGAAALVSYGGNLDQVRTIIRDYVLENFNVHRNLDNPGDVNIAVQDGDIRFYNNYSLNATPYNQVEVTVNRIGGRGNPVSLFLAGVFGLSAADVRATARAEVYNPPGSRCVAPFTVPMPFEYDDLNGNGTMDVQPESKSEVHTIQGRWQQEWTQADIGTRVRLKIGDPSQSLAPGQYSPVDLPPVNKGTPQTGGDDYRQNLLSCNPAVVEIGDLLQMEPGNMVGPTIQGINELIAQDPGAYWDDSTNSIMGSIADDPLGSPRIRIISFYNPELPPTSGRNYVTVVQLGGFFIEEMQGQDVFGVYVGAMASNPGSPGGGQGNPLLTAVRLIRDSTRGVP